ncbi:HD-GYP domain-containing protein [Candidatus Laterigemmans baculatus]|uniref:HD-GYP domain-containing protein n=1 Tax=Candidatus Laterigemmans baculatus TaxID=2770505 RepID=UPI0013DB9055|nr:HD domain-containing phosphohydrolase [Candidatus Laterigemmans baculatus]
MTPPYVMISAAALRVGQPLGVDLYLHDLSTNQLGLYKQADYALHASDLEQLRVEGKRHLYIHREAQDRYHEYLRLLVSDDSGDTPLAARVGAMDEVVRETLRECFASDDPNRIVNTAGTLAQMVLRVLDGSDFTTAELLQVVQHDYSTFTQSANVAYFATLLAKALGLPSADLGPIIAGALLHDIGQQEISDAILCKPGRLDDYELHLVRQHPLNGFRKLCRHDALLDGQLMMVYQHHEKIDGSGYPVGCVGDEIHPWARLCAVVDTFAALISIRPYRGPRTHERALQIMEFDCGLAFEPEMFQCWKKIIEDCSRA